MKSVVTQADTVEAAIAQGLAELGATREQVQVETLQEPKTGLFGLVSVPAEVRLTVLNHDGSSDRSEDDGQLWIEKGCLQSRPVHEEGRSHPLIRVVPPLQATYRGADVQGEVVLDDGIDSLELHWPEAAEPTRFIEVKVSDDKMEALLEGRRAAGWRYVLQDHPPTNVLTLRLAREQVVPEPFSKEEVERTLRFAGVTYGVDMEVVTDELLKSASISVVIAKGERPTPPKHGFIEYMFATEKATRHGTEVDRVDHYESSGIVSVDAETELARRHLPVPGEPGRNVLGEDVSPAPPKEATWSLGEGVALADDGDTAVAQVGGMPVVSGGTLKVLNVYEVQGDADLSTGHVKFKGEVVIRGNVADNVQVQAMSGGVQVYGTVSNALIAADEDIVIHKSAVKAKVQAGGRSVICLQLSTFFHDLSHQIEQLITACDQLKGRTDTADGKLLKSLLELKFRQIPTLATQLAEYFSRVSDQMDPELGALICSLLQSFVGRGPLEVASLDVVRALLTNLRRWESSLEEESKMVSDVTVRYLQNSIVEASGTVVITGQGGYNTRVIAGTGFMADRGVIRGGEVVVEEGNIRTKELGGPTGVATSVTVVHHGTIFCAKAYPNVTLAISGLRYRFAAEARQVKASVRKGELQVYSGNRQLL